MDERRSAPSRSLSKRRTHGVRRESCLGDELGKDSEKFSRSRVNAMPTVCSWTGNLKEYVSVLGVLPHSSPPTRSTRDNSNPSTKLQLQHNISVSKHTPSTNIDTSIWSFQEKKGVFHASVLWISWAGVCSIAMLPFYIEIGIHSLLHINMKILPGKYISIPMQSSTGFCVSVSLELYESCQK